MSGPNVRSFSAAAMPGKYSGLAKERLAQKANFLVLLKYEEDVESRILHAPTQESVSTSIDRLRPKQA
jgi:hypothetical protein